MRNVGAGGQDADTHAKSRMWGETCLMAVKEVQEAWLKKTGEEHLSCCTFS